MEPWLFALIFIFNILCALAFTKSSITALPQTVNIYFSCSDHSFLYLGNYMKILIVHCLMASLVACLFTSSSLELRAQEIKAGDRKKRMEGFLIFYRADSGRRYLLYYLRCCYFPFMPLEIPGMGQLVEYNLCLRFHRQGQFISA